MGRKVSIIGCGWLGLPLAKSLSDQGYSVKGSTTRTEKLEAVKATGAEPFLIRLGEKEGDLAKMLDTEILIVTIPPSKQGGLYMEQMEVLAKAADGSNVSKVIYISATSAYPLNGKEVREEDAERVISRFSDIVWLDVEALFMENRSFDATVVRFSGLMGDYYQPGRYFSGKEIKGAENPVNMIHQDDCVAILSEIIRQDAWNEVFNASADEHPTKREFYGKACEAIGVEPPVFVEGRQPFRIVNSEKMKKRLDYKFIHPNPAEAFD
ncbi:NAD(P)-dependent oxidoreductase [Fulvitalea axinellae]|uniref:NAD(P)-dependent oxidoreductase n=1 Tax=Fulvitalea axinellae TaxID=1182444 RepID=A0AAU9CVT0_9BACT|nr:NAD(P)-dependent oxidoreductase [Fulvitalea axinellae]